MSTSSHAEKEPAVTSPRYNYNPWIFCQEKKKRGTQIFKNVNEILKNSETRKQGNQLWKV
jgi:hypothetical protein